MTSISTMHTRHIVAVEDDRIIADHIKFFLEDASFRVDLVYDEAQALARFMRVIPDLIILDLQLDNDANAGIRLATKIRQGTIPGALPMLSRVPILMLTQFGTIDHEILGMTLADDFLAKPFHSSRLISHIQALLRRIPKLPRIIEFPPLIIDSDSRLVTVHGKKVNLSPNEFKLLHRLAEANGQVIPRTILSQEILGFPYSSKSRNLDILASNLRIVLASAHPPCREMIEAVRGKGKVTVHHDSVWESEPAYRLAKIQQ